MIVKEMKDCIFGNYEQQIGFANKNSYYSIKHQKKTNIQLLETKLAENIPDTLNAKEHYQLLRRKNTKH